MKCDNCKLCLNIIRVENDLFYFCELCYNVYILRQNKKILVEDKNVIEKVKTAYKLKKGWIKVESIKGL